MMNFALTGVAVYELARHGSGVGLYLYGPGCVVDTCLVSLSIRLVLHFRRLLHGDGGQIRTGAPAQVEMAHAAPGQVPSQGGPPAYRQEGAPALASTPAERMKQLEEMRSAGLVNEDEYQQKKQ